MTTTKPSTMLCRADAIGVSGRIRSAGHSAPTATETFYDLAVSRSHPTGTDPRRSSTLISADGRASTSRIPPPLLEKSLAKTCGVPLFQEQLMQMAIDVGGFTGADADRLRQAMGSRRSEKRMAELAEKFRTGAMDRGVDEDTAETIFSTISAFANYGFPESHAISFANLVYQSAWFKYHHHAAFTAGLLRSQPMGFYSPQSLIADARRHKVPILPVDIRWSQAATDLERVEPGKPGHTITEAGAGDGGTASAEELGIRLGLDTVAHVGSFAEVIVTERDNARALRWRTWPNAPESANRPGILPSRALSDSTSTDGRRCGWPGVAGAHPGCCRERRAWTRLRACRSWMPSMTWPSCSPPGSPSTATPRR